MLAYGHSQPASRREVGIDVRRLIMSEGMLVMGSSKEYIHLPILKLLRIVSAPFGLSRCVVWRYTWLRNRGRDSVQCSPIKDMPVMLCLA